MRKRAKREPRGEAIPAAPVLSKRFVLVALLLIVLAGAALRLYHLGQSPPGMNVDEAAVLWNAQCLLKTGMDQHGVRWPFFYTRVYGDIDNRTALYLYYLLPFVAIGGMNVETGRFAAAFSGVLGILLFYYAGKRLFGPGTGLVAAGLLVTNPWHLFQTRSGHEALIMPLLVLAPLAAMLWANFPFDDAEDRPPRPWRAAIAGATAGILCYGYPSIRMFLPLFLAASLFLGWRAWWQRWHDRRWALAIGLMLACSALFFVPLTWKHLTDPNINGRARVTWAWAANDSLDVKIVKVLERYPPHFGLDFLFLRGDLYPALSPPEGYGEFLWYTLPMMLAGIVVVWKRFRTSRAMRLLAAWVVLYPIGDLLNNHPSAHSFRSAPGMLALTMLAAVGVTGAGSWLWQHQREVAVILAGAMILVMFGINAAFLIDFYGSYNRQQNVYYWYQVDYLQALDWLRPRFNDVDVVFGTTGVTPHPYMYSLVRLGYDPKQWFRDPRDVTKGPMPNGSHPYEDVVTHFGKMHFIYGDSINKTIQAMYSNGHSDRAVFIVRPGELASVEKSAQSSLEIRNPQGKVSLLIFELTI